jgi:hypothetical protein
MISPDPVAAEAAAEADCAVSGAEVDFSESAPPHAPVTKTNDRMHNIKEKQLLAQEKVLTLAEVSIIGDNFHIS